MGIGDVFKANRTLKAGEVMSLDWVPVSGLVMYIGGKLQGQPYREIELFKAAMGIWMGDAPADNKVRTHCWGTCKRFFAYNQTPGPKQFGVRFCF